MLRNWILERNKWKGKLSALPRLSLALEFVMRERERGGRIIGLCNIEK